MNQQIVYDLTHFTTTDFVDHLSCIIWFTKCNMRCQYCYNDDIVFAKKGNYTIDYVLDFLQKRVGLLDGVVLSGGEATLNNLFTICTEIKKLGFKIKLDTNGLKPIDIQKLIDKKLVDFISLDYKAPKYKFESITKSNGYLDFEKTLNFLIEKEFDFEVRTTIHADLLTTQDINNMVNYLHKLNYKNKYYLQEFLQTESNIGNLVKSTTYFDKTKIIQNKLDIVYRD